MNKNKPVGFPEIDETLIQELHSLDFKLTKAQARSITRSIFKKIKNEMATGRDACFFEFGTFSLSKLNSRMQKIPFLGGISVQVPEQITIKFKAAAPFKTLINKKL